MDLLVPEPVGFVQEAVQFLAFLGAMPRRLFLHVLEVVGKKAVVTDNAARLESLEFLVEQPDARFLQGHLSLEPLQFLLRSFFAVVEFRMLLPPRVSGASAGGM